MSDQRDDDDDYWPDDPDDYERDEWEEALEECGLLPAHLGGGCTLAGTEHCDFDCPLRDDHSWLYDEEESETE